MPICALPHTGRERHRSIGERVGPRTWSVIRLPVRVHPGAARDVVVLQDDGVLDVRLRARAVEGQANEALVRVLADRLLLRVRDVRLVQGLRSRQKLVEMDLESVGELRRRLVIDA